MKTIKREGILKRVGIWLLSGAVICFICLPAGGQTEQTPRSDPDKLKSPGTALELTLTGTLFPIAALIVGLSQGEDALGLAGLIAMPIGPSLGFFYGGASGRGWLGIGIRTLGFAMSIGGAAWNWKDGDSGDILILGGMVAYVSSCLFDILTVKSVVREHNMELQRKSLSIAPVFSPKSRTAGLQVQLSF